MFQYLESLIFVSKQESYIYRKGSEGEATIEVPQEICKCVSKILPSCGQCKALLHQCRGQPTNGKPVVKDKNKSKRMFSLFFFCRKIMNFITNRGTTKLATTNKGSCGKVMSKLSNLDMMNSIRQFELIFIFNEQFFNFFNEFFYLFITFR